MSCWETNEQLHDQADFEEAFSDFPTTEESVEDGTEHRRGCFHPFLLFPTIGCGIALFINFPCFIPLDVWLLACPILLTIIRLIPRCCFGRGLKVSLYVLTLILGTCSFFACIGTIIYVHQCHIVYTIYQSTLSIVCFLGFLAYRLHWL